MLSRPIGTTASQISAVKNAAVATVPLGDPVQLRAFDHQERSHHVCLRRPKELVAREQHMLELIQAAAIVMEWNTTHPPKRRRIV